LTVPLVGHLLAVFTAPGAACGSECSKPAVCAQASVCVCVCVRVCVCVCACVCVCSLDGTRGHQTLLLLLLLLPPLLRLAAVGRMAAAAKHASHLALVTDGPL
jgi:hypothetical protein